MTDITNEYKIHQLKIFSFVIFIWIGESINELLFDRNEKPNQNECLTLQTKIEENIWKPISIGNIGNN